MDKLHVVCPNCQTINAVVPERITHNPVCAKCGTQLLPTQPVNLTDQTFERYITRSTLPVVVDFWAPWCGPCKMMGPAFAQAAVALQGRVILAKLDTEAHQATAGRFRIQSVPSLIMFRGGREIGRQAGALPAGQIQTWISQRL